MGAIKGRGNKSTELKFRMALIRANISGWKLHKKSMTGTPDFYFEKSKYAVFVDGCFWHGCPKCGHVPKTNTEFWKTKISRNKTRDLKITKELNRQGIRVLRFWEHQIKSDLHNCIIILMNELKSY